MKEGRKVSFRFSGSESGNSHLPDLSTQTYFSVMQVAHSCMCLALASPVLRCCPLSAHARPPSSSLQCFGCKSKCRVGSTTCYIWALQTSQMRLSSLQRRTPFPTSTSHYHPLTSLILFKTFLISAGMTCKAIFVRHVTQEIWS